MPPSVALIGQSERSEFEPVHAALYDEGVQATRVVHTSDSDALQTADLWIVCQSWPEEFSPLTVRRIVSDCAASRLLCVYGAWCASDGRSRVMWPAAVRVPVDELPARLQLELNVIAGRAAPLPMTAARDECFTARVRSL
jgi:hypothetical protein